MSMLETDLQASKVTVSALQERNSDLGKSLDNAFEKQVWFGALFGFHVCFFPPTKEDLHQVMKTQNDELENENASLQGEVSL